MHQYTAAKRADTYKPSAYDLMRVDENWGIMNAVDRDALARCMEIVRNDPDPVWRAETNSKLAARIVQQRPTSQSSDRRGPVSVRTRPVEGTQGADVNEKRIGGGDGRPLFGGKADMAYCSANVRLYPKRTCFEFDGFSSEQ